VAKWIGSEHSEIIIPQPPLEIIDEIIGVTESYDITTIRASTWQYLASVWIAKNTPIKTLLVGDGSDELFGGYLYFKRAPSGEEFITERNRLLDNIHLYDGLRCDRCISANDIEARVPFLDAKLVDWVVNNVPADYLAHRPIEKALLRQAFRGWLPEEIIMRPKVAFSDGVSKAETSWFAATRAHFQEHDEPHRLVDIVPHTGEAKYYAAVWSRKFANLDPASTGITEYWMPRWAPETDDPSARTLLS
jgi:asparagine synthase (glutamine-hydrolysing)